MDSLLVEIGTEEIPAGYIQPALTGLANHLTRKLADQRIAHGKVSTYGTPRRLVIRVDEMAPRQTAATEQILGPPERIAFDNNGQMTVPALKFAEKVGLAPKQLKVVETEKGRYLGAVIRDKGATSLKALQSILPEVILAIGFPKSMRWGDLKISFARPIHSILALLGEKVIPFALDDALKSGRYSFGHRFMAPGRIKIQVADDYLETLRQRHVIADIAERKTMAEKFIREAATSLGGKILPDGELLDTVANLVEIPFPVAGQFDEAFLDLPRDILITAMREHQKYFAVVDQNGNLLPGFVAVNNTRCNDQKLAANGHQRVLRARLADAQFFYQADCRQSMDQWRQQLKGVLFQAKLGSMDDKCRRVEQLGRYLAESVAPELSDHVARAAQLCKADLVSQVVYEFPKLQGIMGRHYASRSGETPEVAVAIEEHYRPTYSGGALPETRTGALLAIADKLDTICGCFAAGLQPSGASDPYALRRQSIGIAHIMLAYNLGFSLKAAIGRSIENFDLATDRTPSEVYDFFVNRMANMLGEQGHAKDIVAAVTSVSADSIPHVWLRTRALQQLKSDPDFEPLAVAFKRAVNILRKAEDDFDAAPEPALFQEPSERGLWEAVSGVKSRVDQLTADEKILEALQTIATLRPPVDEFFDKVMVMSDDMQLRRNRLALLNSIASLFNRIADFSKIGT